MLRKFDDHPGGKHEEFSNALGFTSTKDLVRRGGMARPARRIAVKTAGTLWLRNGQDGSEVSREFAAGEEITTDISEIARGNRGNRISAAGTYPAAPAGGETMVVNLDAGTDHASGNITVTFQATDTTQALMLARINAAINAALPPAGGHPAAVYALDAGAGVSHLFGRSRGTGAGVQIVSIHATIATATGWSAGTTAGTNFASPADLIEVFW